MSKSADQLVTVPKVWCVAVCPQLAEAGLHQACNSMHAAPQPLQMMAASLQAYLGAVTQTIKVCITRLP